MGYRYYYTMAVESITSEESNTIIDILENHSGYHVESCPTTNDGYYYELSGVSWDEPEAPLMEISEKFPGRVFAMSYEGDSWDDRGYVYAKDGRIQECKVIVSYEEPDEFFK